MFNIKPILTCPECQASLEHSLKCSGCNNLYRLDHGVYNIISQNISDISDFSQRELDETGFPVLNTEEHEWHTKRYYGLMNEETLAIRKKQKEYADVLYSRLSGVVCDLATGGGSNLENLLYSDNKNFTIVCADIDVHQLMQTRKQLNTDDGRVIYIGTDGKHLSFKDQCFDFVVSLSGFGNIPEGDKVAKEVFRTLKPGGKIILQSAFIEKGSKSHELAKSVGVERGMIEDYAIADLEKAGFINIVVTKTEQAIWAENEYDLLPVAGDLQELATIQAERPS